MKTGAVAFLAFDGNASAVHQHHVRMLGVDLVELGPDQAMIVELEPAGEGMAATGPQIAVATFVAFVLGYVSIAWLLKFVSHHSMVWFAGYRVILGSVVIGLLAAGVITS